MFCKLAVNCGRGTSWTTLAAVVGVALCLSGCGGSGSLAKVTGKVTYQGQPVVGGSLTFVPVGSVGGSGPAAKPAAGVVQADGTYTLGTQSTSDGVAIGRHRVMYSPPAVELPPGKTLEPGESWPKSPYDGLAPKVAEVDVTGRDSVMDIELVAQPVPGAQ